MMAAVFLRPDIVLVQIRNGAGIGFVASRAVLVDITFTGADAIIGYGIQFAGKEKPESEPWQFGKFLVSLNADRNVHCPVCLNRP